MLFNHIFFEYGLIETGETTGAFYLAPKYIIRNIFQYVDVLTNNIFSCFPEWLNERGCHPKHAPASNTLRTEMDQVNQLNGYLQFAMHIAVVIFELFYFGFLQTINFVLGWRKIMLML